MGEVVGVGEYRWVRGRVRRARARAVAPSGSRRPRLGQVSRGKRSVVGMFLSEQGAQLALKGLLHAVGEHAKGWGHDLGPLEQRVATVFGDDWPEGLLEPAM